MEIHLFYRMQYESFICIAFDTSKYRYWYNVSTPLFLRWFPISQVDDRFRTKEEKAEEKKTEKSIGFEKISIQNIIESTCHIIHHIRCCFWNIKHDKYWAKIEPGKYGNYTKWYVKLFSRKYFEQHQYQCLP